jgi:hypothetical protein
MLEDFHALCPGVLTAKFLPRDNASYLRWTVRPRFSSSGLFHTTKAVNPINHPGPRLPFAGSGPCAHGPPGQPRRAVDQYNFP